VGNSQLLLVGPCVKNMSSDGPDLRHWSASCDFVHLNFLSLEKNQTCNLRPGKKEGAGFRPPM